MISDHFWEHVLLGKLTRKWRGFIDKEFMVGIIKGSYRPIIWHAETLRINVM